LKSPSVSRHEVSFGLSWIGFACAKLLTAPHPLIPGMSEPHTPFMLDFARCIAFLLIFPRRNKHGDAFELGKSNRRTVIAASCWWRSCRAPHPPGFMPASGQPLSLEICWEACLLRCSRIASLPLRPDGYGCGVHVHGLHARGLGAPPGGTPQGEHCVFGTACSAGRPPLPLPGDFSPAITLRAVASHRPRLASRRSSPQAEPPSRLS